MADNLNTRGNKFCLNHLKEEVKFLCENCKEKACVSCVSSTHKGHNLVGINTIVQEKYNKLQDLSSEIQGNKIPRIKKIFHEAEDRVKLITDGIRTNMKTAEDHGNYLKGLIETSTAETISELKELEQNITKQLDMFKSECDSSIQRLEDVLKESKEASKSNNDVLIVDVEEHMSTLTIKEPTFECKFTPATFIKGLINIKEAIGGIAYDQSPSALQAPSSTEMLVEPVISKILDLSDKVDSIQGTRQGTLFLISDDFNELTSIEKNGPKKKLKFDVPPVISLCEDPVDNQLYCCTSTDIRTLDTKTGKTTTIFDCDSPRCINVANNNSYFIVGTRKEPEVKMYDRRGNVLQTVKTEYVPFSIAVCRHSGLVAISCGEGGTVVMQNKSDRLQQMYTYRPAGDLIGIVDATIDLGRLLVPDYVNNKLYIANAASGRTLKIINVDSPLYVAVQMKGDLAIVCENEKKTIFGKSKKEQKLINIKYLA